MFSIATHLKLLGCLWPFYQMPTVFHQDRTTLRSYAMHMYRWGEHAPFVRGEIKRSRTYSIPFSFQDSLGSKPYFYQLF